MSKRQLSAGEKDQVVQQQRSTDGLLRCFISAEAIDAAATDSYEFDHLTAWALDGPSDLVNVRVVKKEYNRKKGIKTLYEARDNYRLEKLFEEKKNNIKLQDIFQLKEITPAKLVCQVNDSTVVIAEGSTTKNFGTYHEPILQVPYFYSRVPVRWLENDDQEGLQPRVIDYRRLVELRNHLRERPQLAPSIARLVGNRLRLFDGQHKLAAQVLNGATEVDMKIYVSPEETSGQRNLFDALMRTNLDAHSKLKQVPFYTSTLLDRLSVIYRDLLDQFLEDKPVESHTEEQFVAFMMSNRGMSRSEAHGALKASIKTAVLGMSALKPYVAEASRDLLMPMTQDLLDKTIYPAVLYLAPSKARFNTDQDRRDQEARNFGVLASILVEQTKLAGWIAAPKGTSLTNEQRKVRRIWHKGAVLTWAPYLESVLNVALHLITTDDRTKKLYRSDITDSQKEALNDYLERLFSHPFWDDNDQEIDILLVSAQRQEELFTRKGLTETYVLTGH
ncbi:hypothetical protein GCM10011375_18940 [Hymenobacter qilianensis]|uniref:Uncharacterized protein n=2 Tax=Hymenobacter qilianensis TaxID=1385715 RepID=A0ACB5PR73_9BACT|nr:chromosome partitioning protein ParB [Hymenobacter qilianensis]QNP52069.1 chromosome partitioning protein ParB [Hymenobacter qilianensis]GGF64280.1 hypothetical protein GCM10011375_18940 [Hymenobacter qilianensis]